MYRPMDFLRHVMHMCMATLYWCCSESEGERERGREGGKKKWREFTNDSVHTVVDICNENLSTFFDKLLEKCMLIANMFNNVAKWFKRRS